MKTSTQKIVKTSLIAALCCIATMIIKIPSPLNGYLNLGDCVVIFAGWLFSPMYGFLAAGFGSALADIFLGYVVYSPATFVIKGIMAAIVSYSYKCLKEKKMKVVYLVIFGAIAEIFMVLGYYIFESILYGFAASAVNIPANSMQGIAGLIIGMALIKIFEKRLK